MRHTAKFISTTASVAALLGSMTVAIPAISHADQAAIKEGKEIAVNRTKGNCLSCHKMDDGTLPGNIGPELIGMKERFPDKAVLRAQIYDSRINNPATIMPPMGAHGILSNSEIDKVVEYVYSL